MHAELAATGRDLRLLLAGMLTSVLATVVWATSLALAMGLAPILVGLLIFVISTRVWRAVADLDRANAAAWLGRPVGSAYRERPTGSFWDRMGAAAGDPQTWRDFVWLFLHGMLGTAFGAIAVGAIATVAGALSAPAWWWALPDIEWDVPPLALVPLALPIAGVAWALLRGMAWAEAHMAAALLGPRGAAPATPRGPAADPRIALGLHASLAVVVGFVCLLVWGLTGAGYFWPIWVWLGLAITAGSHASVVRHMLATDSAARFRAKSELCGGIAAVCLAVWALSGMGYFWPVWPILGMAASLVVDRLWSRRTLVERVDELTRTRSGALDVQAAELRRIERDLHDGAQARLVALSMQLGRAEERLADQPEVAELVRQSRLEAGAAIAELRDLARGIAPPVLADRGLGAAVEALARRSPVAVNADVALDTRPPGVVETGAYFVVSEALTNVAKHAPGASARVVARTGGGRLLIEVADDGPGGADATGGGLTGLRHRVEALDGTLAVASTPEGTTIRAEIPCGS